MKVYILFQTTLYNGLRKGKRFCFGVYSSEAKAVDVTKENEFYKPSSFWHSVWFQPSSGRFLFADQYTRYEVVEPLIENKTLIFVGAENHQGEQMLRYVLSQGCR